MAFTLENVALWGRSFEEYEAMFALDSGDLEKSILGCGDGPASFNASLTRRGGTVVSADPVYRFSAGKIASRRAGEVRFFPLLELGAVPSRHVEAVLSGLSSQGYHANIERVDYEFQKGGNTMLRIRPLVE